jgi:hypothetical protein
VPLELCPPIVELLPGLGGVLDVLAVVDEGVGGPPVQGALPLQIHALIRLEILRVDLGQVRHVRRAERLQGHAGGDPGRDGLGEEDVNIPLPWLPGLGLLDLLRVLGHEVLQVYTEALLHRWDHELLPVGLKLAPD